MICCNATSSRVNGCFFDVYPGRFQHEGIDEQFVAGSGLAGPAVYHFKDMVPAVQAMQVPKFDIGHKMMFLAQVKGFHPPLPIPILRVRLLCATGVR